MSSRQLDNFIFDSLYMCMIDVGFLGLLLLLLLLLFLGWCVCVCVCVCVCGGGWFPKFGKKKFPFFFWGIFVLHLRAVLVHA